MNEEIRIPVPWGHIAVVVSGNSGGIPVVLVHGTRENAGTFERLISLLSPSYYYIAVDLPGHGLSSNFRGGQPIEFMDNIAALHRVTINLKLKNYILIGQSMGATMSAFFASAFPEKVLKLILIEPAFIPLQKDCFMLRWVYGWLDILKYENKPVQTGTYEEILQKFKNERVFQESDEAVKAIAKRNIAKVGEHYQITFDPRNKKDLGCAIYEEEYLAVFRRIKCPLLYIFAKDSELKCLLQESFLRVATDFMKTMNKETQIVHVEGNHVVHNNNPERVAPIINKFLMTSVSKY